MNTLSTMGNKLLHGIQLLSLLSSSFLCQSFTSPARRRCQETGLNLVPISKFKDDFSFLQESADIRCCVDREGRFLCEGDDPYSLSLMEKQDLAAVAEFTMRTFGADIIALSQDMTRLEKAIFQPAIGMMNSYSGMVAYAEILSGLQSRTTDRIEEPDLSPPMMLGSTPNERLGLAQKSSLVLVLAKNNAEKELSSSDIVGAIELRLQVCFSLRYDAPTCHV